MSAEVVEVLLPSRTSVSFERGNEWKRLQFLLTALGDEGSREGCPLLRNGQLTTSVEVRTVESRLGY